MNELVNELVQAADDRQQRREVTGVTLAPTDTAQLADMLHFVSDWLSRDRYQLEPSLESFVGGPAYATRQLRDDLARFTFPPGGSDGEPLFDSGRQKGSCSTMS